ncbi:hypothetical protein G647_04823 [Cladophialophora carrionii CBS 160.54]|uniref:Bacteriophage T5 Orf172 DNA-binding domain-containing protein n=1 Tax=Cladophialophora carrionii CBS 160.54 TaxID=1279043 RepID=V9DAM8_9EURO|nr:uncharacterized protein G647_04823 [Cladophialophora carrionii CBS 160.54]ETI23027.1 hypothetical protein G647_04823 [Cladophialophora carrionii CBS 160.54]
MTSVHGRRILTPHRRRPASQQTSTHPLISLVNLDHASYTPSPATPELEWVETPPATEDPQTPGHHPELDDGVLSPHSPLAVRNTDLERHDIHVLDLSQLDSDVPKQILSKQLSETSPSRRLFQTELSNASLSVPSWRRPSPPSGNAPVAPGSILKSEAEEVKPLRTALPASGPRPSSTQSCDGTIGTHAAAGRIPAVANSIKTENALVSSEGTVVATSKAEPPAINSTTTPSPCSSRKKPLTLSVAWELNAKLSKILPFEAVERFQADRRRCIATTQAGSRCQNSTTRTSKGDFVAELSEALLSLQRSFDFAAFAKHMAPQIESVMCKRWHRTQSLARLDELSSYSWKPQEMVTSNAHRNTAIANSVEAVFKLWSSALVSLPPPRGNAAEPPAQGDVDRVQGTRRSTFDFSRATAEGDHVARHQARPKAATAASRAGPSQATTGTRKPESAAPAQVMVRSKTAHVSTHLNHRFVKYIPFGKNKDLTPEQLIRQILPMPLTPADMHRTGFIYIYWHPPNMGYVKIGYSTNVEKRLADWKRQCRFDLAEHKTEESAARVRICHLHRVEALIHAELKEYRLLEPSCTGCGRSHKEWFHVHPNHAQRVRAKWTSRSFYSGGLLDDGLRDEDIDKLCELTEAEPLPPLSRSSMQKTTKAKVNVKISRWSSNSGAGGGGRREVRGRR